MPVNAVGTSNSANTYAEAAQKILGKDDFLKLLITELRYQDPTNPMNDREFISQMAQFSSLEQMQNLNNNFVAGFQALTYQLYMNSLNEGLNLLGKEVTYVDSEGTTHMGIVEGIRQKNGYYTVVVNGVDVELEQITLVKK